MVKNVTFLLYWLIRCESDFECRPGITKPILGTTFACTGAVSNPQHALPGGIPIQSRMLIAN
ncbi:hypothetical protein DXV75_03515 [Alteromonas aestuariivivens]|uniref:Uncharacterized protein n=1 Tax=Alteromonas aestuariivivens TaxID=1938339 RepID=A0A3D8MC34_9ALTE|nr:hypothetical protein DXV75_03515 [Alteromonas aestuariivivens]